MPESSVLTSIRAYKLALESSGLAVEHIVLFGSHVTGRAHSWSDIDVVVVSPDFDHIQDRSGISLLWRIAARVDSRIEPIACGSHQWREDDSSAIIEIARREGEILDAA